jgi:hypothetical protein
MIVQVDGAGDAEGAEIHVEAQYADIAWEPFGLAYEFDMETVHVSEVE